ncbi:peptidyl-prolyl cis-trans isomerase, cyclophilin-type [Rhodotorula toruloides]|uniref:peptidylprolyl isomerase n=1 Tax=Rhodotorula toruloides TaxID=5286 RepID=A0A511KLS9_RHOTO|nr:peptidyl-prolyl cis-trans isomerase, cyclophilin-type [Rhodotorula toruloides]
MVNPRVFLDFAVEGEPIGRVIFELFADVVPETAENFRALCTGSKGVNEIGIPLWYKGCPMHRIIAGFMVQGGDFTMRNGKGGESIYGPTFEDEDLKREIDSEGLLCMANKGRGTNSSQFFVTLLPCPHLNGKHVVFGKVVKGYEIIVAMSKMPVDAKDHPTQLVTISHCGELERRVAAKPKTPPPPSPSTSSRSRSRSRSVSRSPSPDRKRSRSSRHRSRRHDTDESGSENDDRRRRHRSSSHRSSSHKHHSSRRHKHRSSRRSASPERKEDSPELSAEQIAALEAQKREEEAAAWRRREEEEREAEMRRREAGEARERYEREQIAKGGIIYKGRGKMKADSGRGGMRGW